MAVSPLTPVSAASAAGPPLSASQVDAAVTAVINARNARLVKPSSAARVAARTSAITMKRAVSGLRLNGAAARAETTTARLLGVRRARVASAGVQYSDATVAVTVSSLAIDGSTAVASVKERSRFTFVRVDTGTPPFMEQTVRRTVKLVRGPSGWQVVGLAPSGTGMAPVNDVAPGDDAAAVGPLVDPAPPRGAAKVLTSSGTVAGSGPLSGRLLARAYNYTKMKDYAYRYYTNYNGNYKEYGNDCTNFISQAMSAGGWGEVSGFYQSTSAWWYNHIVGNPTSLENASWTWTSVGHWYSFATSTGRTTLLSSTSSLGIADVLQMDFTNNGTKDHTMIVTSFDSRTKYLTYHTTDTVDRPLADIRAAYPSARYLPHRT